MSDEADETKSFTMNISPEKAQGMMLNSLLNVRATVNALAIIVMRELAKDEAHARELAREFEKLQEDFLLTYAFQMQDRPAGGAEEGRGEGRE